MLDPKPGGREKLLEAAAEFFGSRGYEATGVALILEHAGVKPPTLYHHFSDKEGLYLVWAESAFAGIEPRFAGPYEPEALKALSTFARTLMESVPFDYTQVLRDAGSMARPESREKLVEMYYQALYEPLCTILLRAMERDEVRPEPVGRMADVFIAGAWQLRGPHPRENAVDLAGWWTRIFLSGVRQF